MLSCSCDLYNCADFYEVPEDFSKLDTKRGRRCKSCNSLIKTNDLCVELRRWRDPKDDIEERIYIDEVPIGDLYYCEKCGEIFFNLSELGYCLNPEISMQEYLKYYHEITGFKNQ